MSFLDTLIAPGGGFLGSTSFAALGLQCAALAQSAAADGTWPTANLALFIPFVIPRDMLVARVGWVNGATAAGNCDVGVYDLNGQRLRSSGSTAAAGASIIQLVSVTPTWLAGPGVYYLAMASDAGGTQKIRSVATNLELLKACGMAQMATALPLPAAATLAAITNSFLPLCGLSFAPVA